MISRLPNRFARLSTAGCAVALLVVAMAGCGGGEQELNTEYGVRRAPRDEGSVAGVGVLADMFEERGHRVRTWKRISPKIRENDVIIWAPDAYDPPSEEARRFLEDWLHQQDGRTLVYVGRDYHPEVEYWKKMRSGAPAEQAKTIERRLARARSARDSERAQQGGTEYGRWFTSDFTKPVRQVNQLSGKWVNRWKRGQAAIDPQEIDIELGGLLRIPTEKETPAEERGQLEFEELLKADGDVIVSRVRLAEDFTPPPPVDDEDAAAIDKDDAIYGDPLEDPYYNGDEDSYYYDEETDEYRPAPTRRSTSQIIVVANGSFLLNLPLVNKQHRLLAGKLIEECEIDENLDIAILETGPMGAEVYNTEPNPPSYLDLLRVWPLNVILLHILGLGVLVCFYFAPIFGRPMDRKVLAVVEGRPIYAAIGAEQSGPSDFGRHIEELGELMSKTGEVDYARSRLDHYERNVKRDSGVSHRNKPPADKPPPDTSPKR